MIISSLSSQNSTGLDILVVHATWELHGGSSHLKTIEIATQLSDLSFSFCTIAVVQHAQISCEILVAMAWDIFNLL